MRRGEVEEEDGRIRMERGGGYTGMKMMENWICSEEREITS